MGLPTSGKDCQFSGIRRYWDERRAANIAQILPGEYFVTSGEEYIATLLGSCVSACVWDPLLHVGGMNHFMLPQDASARGQWAGVDELGKSNRYGVFAMESLINGILQRGGRRAYLKAKLFGGGRVLKSMSDVGQRNISFARKFLDSEGIPSEGEDLGGPWPRKVLFHPVSGKAFVKRLRRLDDSGIAQRERDYLRDIQRRPVSGSVELF